MSFSSFEPSSPKIVLSPLESQITTLLKDYSNQLNQKISYPQEPLQLRITGGWVRDKLLGQASHDLDIAVNTLSGQAFAEGLVDYLKQNPQYGMNPSGIHTIEKNPEKSKHLETATTKLFGLDVDFVNLRSEEYTEESRIPVMKFGTPEEDALRRDATLNALFYNIQEDKVEDLTTKGLQDLKDGILRTPLEPKKTFLDDPLRVLRLVRFASRFGFDIEKETYEAMKGQDVKKALMEKISRERVGVEIGKALDSNPVKTLDLLSDAKLLGVVFGFGNLEHDIRSFNDPIVLQEIQHQVEKDTFNAVEIVSHFKQETTVTEVISKILEGDLKRLFWLCITLKPWSGVRVIFNKKQKDMFATEAIVKEGLKFSKNEAEIITRILSSKDDYQKIVSRLPEYQRSEIGLLLKKYGENFDLAFVFNLFEEYIHSGASILKKYESFYDLVHKEHLEDVYKIKPLLDGKTVSKKLERKPGPWMSKVMDAILVWQLDNPDKSEDDCIEYVKSIINDV